MEKRRYQSLFWPILLIGVGVIWLLSNFGLLPAGSLALLFTLWPLVLIVIGIDLLFGRSSPLVGGLIGLLLVGALLFALLAGPTLGIRLPNTGQVKVERFSEPVGQTTSAVIRINASSDPVEVTPISGDQLVDAEIGHTGTFDFSTRGDTEKTITFDKRSTPGSWMINPMDSQRLKWKIGLNNQIPLRLEVDGASGPLAMDLTGMKLTGMDAETASGSVSISLPQSDQAYPVNLDTASGSVNLTLPENTDLTLTIGTGSGSVKVNLPANAAVRVEALDDGSGSLNVGGLTKMSGGDRDDEGMWESQGYASAARKILIRLEDVGSGSINIQ